MPELVEGEVARLERVLADREDALARVPVPLERDAAPLALVLVPLAPALVPLAAVPELLALVPPELERREPDRLEPPEPPDPDEDDSRARVRAAFWAEALRSLAFRLRVRAAFFAAASRFAGPPVARSSNVSASARSSLAVLRSAEGALPPVSFAFAAASATVRATFLRTPPARTVL